METGTALSRAMAYVMQRNKDPSKQRIDAINMSYGEYSHWSSSGRVGELMAEVINNSGVVWLASAGNDGPVQLAYPGSIRLVGGKFKKNLKSKGKFQNCPLFI